MNITHEGESVRRGDRRGWRGDSLYHSHAQQLYITQIEKTISMILKNKREVTDYKTHHYDELPPSLIYPA